MNKRLCITPCGKKKIWDKLPNAGTTRAQDVYIGAFANACQAYAGQFFDTWVILSAKHGFLFPDDLLHENYDVSFTSPQHQVISAERLQQQLREKGLTDVEEVVVLGGRKYQRAARSVFDEGRYNLVFPLEGCRGIGYMLQTLNQAVSQDQEIRPL